MSGRARAWLAMRAGAVPPGLEAEMENAIDDVIDDDMPVSSALGEAARICLRRALRHCDEREGALPLLAADALLTYACEAATLEDGDALTNLALTNEPARLARLLPGKGA